MASLRINPHTNPRQRSAIGTTRFWFSCLLCLCAWRGPMPIVHNHSFQPQELASNVHLAAHLASHHAHDIDHGTGGWHVHFVLPANGSDDVPSDEDSAAPSLAWPTALQEQTVHASSSDFAPLEGSPLDAGQECTGQGIAYRAEAVPPAPPDVVLKRISPQAWLCIARC